MSLGTEKRAPAAPEVVGLIERPAAIVEIDCTLQEFPRMLGNAFRDTAEAITRAGGVIAGHPFARYLSLEDRIVAEAGFPFAGSVPATDRVRILVMPGGRAVKATHAGSYDTIGETWERAQSWMREQALDQAGPAWECYLTGPDDPPPTLTEVFFPVA